MENTCKKMKNLFLRQSCQDSFEEYQKSLESSQAYQWDYVILTASNEEQAQMYRAQIHDRLEHHFLPDCVEYAVLPDPDGKRVGSGGATLNVMAYVSEREIEKKGQRTNPFEEIRILVIHSGGDSKRVPQYSALGKLFSPVPRQLPDGRGSTLFDEFIIGMSGVPSRIKEGMLVLSGDVLLLFNPLQIDFSGSGAAAVSMKESVEIGKDHGVFLNSGDGFVKSFLHKQTEETLRELGAVNRQGNVDLDTGAIILASDVLGALFSLVCTDGTLDRQKFSAFVNEEARISFYGDFLYPLAKTSSLEQYYKEAAEGVINDALLRCRKEIWDAIHGYDMKLICLSPAEFIHFGTTSELLELVTKEVEDYEFLDWSKKVVFFCDSNASVKEHVALHNAIIAGSSKILEGSYMENSSVTDCMIGRNTIISGVAAKNTWFQDDMAYHMLKQKDGRFVLRMYGIGDNPKALYEKEDSFAGTCLKNMIEQNGIDEDLIWENGQDRSLWLAKLYPVMKSEEEALKAGEWLYHILAGTASDEEKRSFILSDRRSLCSSFNMADGNFIMEREKKLEEEILAERFIQKLKDEVPYFDALKVFSGHGITASIYEYLLDRASKEDVVLSMRIYQAVSAYMKKNKCEFRDGESYDQVAKMFLNQIAQVIYEDTITRLPDSTKAKIVKEEVKVELPVRVNWGGGWTDTPPYCIENGGVVLNAAIQIEGKNPIHVTVRKLKDLHVEFESCDTGARGTVHSVEEIQNCHDPFDPFALHKAALIACGIIPLNQKTDLETILSQFGGGFYLSTEVINIPKGSGLGTSSVLAAACVKGLFEFLGIDLPMEQVYDTVLSMEQIMSTGGGWQDQVGGLVPGVKLITTKPGIHQLIHVEQIHISDETKKELQERFALIYTGQRRLARNLLRDVVGGYVGRVPDSVDALRKMKPLSALMRFALEQGDVDEFAELLNKHWVLSKQLDAGSTNTCIDQMFLSIEDLIDGRFISGAGGGGFLQVILKKGVTHEMLSDRLHEIFQDSGVEVWDSSFVYE